MPETDCMDGNLMTNHKGNMQKPGQIQHWRVNHLRGIVILHYYQDADDEKEPGLWIMKMERELPAAKLLMHHIHNLQSFFRHLAT